MKMTPTKVMILQFNLPLDTSSDGLVATASNLWALCIDIRGETGRFYSNKIILVGAIFIFLCLL